MLKLQFADNRQASFWIVDENFGIGSDIKNQMVIKDDQIRPFHATINQKNSRLFINPCDAQAVIAVNGSRVVEATEIVVGDVIHLGNIELRLIDPARQHARNPAMDKPAQKVADVTSWQLKAMTGPLAGKLVNIDSTKVVGRDPAADIVISGGHISRRHAEFLLREAQLWVRDLNSSNGTYVNNRRTEEQPLYLGDEVKFDAVIFRVVVGKAPPKGKDAPPADLGMDKTQFRPALNIPIAGRPAEISKPTIPTVPTPTPMPRPSEPAPSLSVSSTPAPAPSPAPSLSPDPQGVKISLVLLVAMVIVLALLVGLVVLGLS
jgi:pSer/pThr/pTyr-binding forkhead associated (FHA) protein